MSKNVHVTDAIKLEGLPSKKADTKNPASSDTSLALLWLPSHLNPAIIDALETERQSCPQVGRV